MVRELCLLIVPSLVLVGIAAGQAVDSTTAEEESFIIRRGEKGFEFESGDGNFLLQLDSRLQFRYAYPQDTDPVTYEDFVQDPQQILKVNRARLKIGGHAFKPWLTYYWEYDLVGSNLLDFRVMIERFRWLNLKVGQWKIHYSRERVISSGAQQLADRSIINRLFTIDRQQGVSLYGRVELGGPVDVSYWGSVLMGTGRGGGSNDDDRLMWMGRLQWNPLGTVVPFSGSDLKYLEKPALLIAVAGVTNQSQYTAFSTAGGSGPGPDGPGEPGQYIVDQVLIETAFMYAGWSWQHESHWKRVEDTVNRTEDSALGSYFQGGFHPHAIFRDLPEQLELAGRYAYYIPDTDFDNDLHHEVTVAANWFFSGHRNKLTAEISIFDLVDAQTGESTDEFRVRLQWDVSL